MPKQDIGAVILVAVVAVLILTLYFHNRLSHLRQNSDGNSGSRAMPRRYRDETVQQVDLGQDTGRDMIRIERVNPTTFELEDKGDDYYPNLQLPPQVIGGGRRMIPTYGGSQIPIANPTMPVNVSSANIAPVNIYQPDMTDSFRQVGVIMKVFGENNQMLPLFGREKWPNSNKWLYYTKIGKFGVSLPVKSAQHSGYEFQLQDNDEVIIKGVNGKYRVTTYDTDSTDYIPVNI